MGFTTCIQTALTIALSATAHSTAPAALSAPADSVQTLAFEWGAVNLTMEEQGDTVQLRAIPRTKAGAPMRDVTVHYSTLDTAITVSPTGLVTAHTFTDEAPAHVIASVTQGERTLTDTAVIQVTAWQLPAPLAKLSIHPQPGGLKRARGNLNNSQRTMPFVGNFPFFATMKTGKPANDTICNANGCEDYPLVVHFTSSDPSIAYINNNAEFHPLRPGRVTFTISTIAYGVRKRDSLQFSVGYDQMHMVKLMVDSSHRPAVLAVRPMSKTTPPYSVGFRYFITNATNEPVEMSLPTPAHGVNFDERPATKRVDTLAAANTNIEVLFDSAGTYMLHYHGLTTNAMRSDTITVVPYP